MIENKITFPTGKKMSYGIWLKAWLRSLLPPTFFICMIQSIFFIVLYRCIPSMDFVAVLYVSWLIVLGLLILFALVSAKLWHRVSMLSMEERRLVAVDPMY